MKIIEKLISPLVENQFPAFYREDGPQFIAFVKAYYEWLEQSGLPGSTAQNTLYQSRSLPSYRDIDDTLDDFIVHFKEKYLKNIQFDTASNKKLLVKNALDLYRSKGTERSIDLFFKLVYGTDAEVNYPGENVLRVSDGIWEKPEYLEITYSKFNVDYVGKQVVGSLSGAKAFVEKLIRRSVGRGFVNILYVTGIQGTFRNGEMIGLNVNNTPVFDKVKRANLIGSVNRVTILTGGANFTVGDIVSFTDSERGQGGLARVSAVSNTTGVVDFLLVEGGYGYTLTADSLVSEKVVTFANAIANSQTTSYFTIFEPLVQPLINVVFDTASANLTVGDTLYRYRSGSLVGAGKIIQLTQTGANGSVLISPANGTFTVNTLYNSTSISAPTTVSLNANTVTDRTIVSSVMAVPEIYTFTISGNTGIFTVGTPVYQKNTSAVYARGTVNSVTVTESTTTLVVDTATGAWKRTGDTVRTDSVTFTDSGDLVTLNSHGLTAGQKIKFTSITSTTGITTNTVYYVIEPTLNTFKLSTAAGGTAINLVTNGTGTIRFEDWLESQTSPDLYSSIDNVKFTIGVYDIKRSVATLRYYGANNDKILDSSSIFQYNSNNEVIARATVVTSTYSSNSGNLTVLVHKGYFNEFEKFYTTSNTAEGYVQDYTVSIAGGSMVESANSLVLGLYGNTQSHVDDLSYGSQASFDIGSLGDTEVIFVNTDRIAANNQAVADLERVTLTANSTGFVNGSIVSQESAKIKFNPSTAVNLSSGFITLPTNANDYFGVGDLVIYGVDAGNTEINGYPANSFYYVYFSNTTGIMLSYPHDRANVISNSSYVVNFGNNIVSEAGHFIYKPAYGTVFDAGAGYMRIKNSYGAFDNTVPGGNTTVYGTSNIMLVTNTSVNTEVTNTDPYTISTLVSKPFYSLPIRVAAYGFPKNVQGDYADVIYKCLTFGRFEIGVIGTLKNINPGSEYDMDPYVTAYQPYVADFGRRDYKITISNPTGSFITGEKITQTSSSLTYYDLKVDSGVYSNTFDEIVRTVDSAIDIDGTNDFIYVPSNTVTFNSNTNVDDTSEFISIANNLITDNTVVRYYTVNGNTALQGLTNNTLYYVISSNTSGLKLTTAVGNTSSIVNITANSTASGSNTAGHTIRSYVNPYSNDDLILYYTPSTNTVISGLTNAAAYFAVSSNTTGLALSLTKGGSNVNITNAAASETHYLSTVPGYLPFDRVYETVYSTFNSNSSVNGTDEFISIAPQPYSNNDVVLYKTISSNVALGGLTNNTSYFVISANSTGVKLATEAGNTSTIVDITANGTASGAATNGHTLTATATGVVDSVYVTGANLFVRVGSVVNHFASGNVLYSNTNAYVNANILAVTNVASTTTAKGVIKSGSNTSVLNVKRIQFENVFQTNTQIVGGTSGTTATVTGISEDLDLFYPIGLNASIEANVVTANGRVTTLQVIDSGFGYVNSESISFVSEDGSRSGTARVTIDGYGIGKGYYRSSKGFLSEDMYVHDGDYYQEYSYEILSKMSFEKYADMYKKVMHVAGTKVFGSALVVEEAEANVEISQISTGQQVSFNADLDVNSSDDTIELDVRKDVRYFNSLSDIDNTADFIQLTNNPFSDGTYVVYSSNTGTFPSGMANATAYYVVSSNSSGIKLSTSVGGSVINIAPTIAANTWHYFTSYVNPFANGDLALYTVASGNTPLESNINISIIANSSGVVNSFILSSTKIANGTPVLYTTPAGNTELSNSATFNSNSGVNSSNDFITISHSFSNGDLVRYYTTGGNTALQGLSNGAYYFVISANTTGLKLTTVKSKVTSVVNVTANGTASGANTSGHVLFRGVSNNTTYYAFRANSTGFYLSNSAGGPNTFALTIPASHLNETHNIKVSQLSNGASYYVVNTTPNTVKLSLAANGASINITKSSTSEIGHFLTKIVEEN